MIVHLVGGFLGSGKTTAISNSCNLLFDSGIKTSVITNDQGKYLVDSRFIQLSDIPVSEVTNGCFCCNYNELDTQINTMINEINPAVIFAEFVGSCTDLISTVLKPLLTFKKEQIEFISFSTFVDSQLLLMYLSQKQLPFSMETNYIWEKQIEESEILVVNKIDLLADSDLKKIMRISKKRFSSKKILFQNSLDPDSVYNWVNIISKSEQTSHKTIDIDYNIYGKGEADLAWLDEEIEIVCTENSAFEKTCEFIKRLEYDINNLNLTVGHLKFFLTGNNCAFKISYTTIKEDNEKIPQIFEKTDKVNLLVNARIQTSPEILRNIFFNNLEYLKSIENTTVNEKFLSYFKPGCPNPVHRFP